MRIAPVEAAKIEVGKNISNKFLMLTYFLNFQFTAPTAEQKVGSRSLEIESPLSRSKRAADVPYTSKRCIEDLLRSGPLLGAANPSMTAKKADCERYDDESQLSQSKNTLDDNQAEESKLQAIPLNQNRIVIGSSRDDYKFYNVFRNVLQPSKSDTLIHGHYASNSIESNESSQKSKSNNQINSFGSNSSGGNVNDKKSTVVQPGYESYNSNQNYNSPQYTNIPPQSQNEQNREQRPYFENNNPKAFRKSPSSIITTLYDPQLASHNPHSESESSPSDEDSGLSSEPQNLNVDPQLLQSDLNQAPDQLQEPIVGNQHTSGPTYNSQNFDELLNQMQSTYQSFHSGMSQLLDSFKSQSSSFQNMMDQRDSHSSHSKHFDFNARCQNQNEVNADPQLSKMCHLDYGDQSRNSDQSGNSNQVPLNVPPTNEFQNQFVSYADYVKMVRNVNRNSGTLLVGHNNGELLGAAAPLTEESEEHPIGHHKQGILNDLRVHIDSFTDEEQVAAAAPEPEQEGPQVEAEIDPIVANPAPEETIGSAQDVSLKSLFITFLDKLHSKNKLLKN